MEGSNLEDLDARLELLRAKHTHREAQILQYYSKQISRYNDDCSIIDASSPSRSSFSPARGDSALAESVIERLELALLEAKSQLIQQQKLLRDIKFRHGQETFSAAPNSRVVALSAVRSELNDWVNEKLAASDLDPGQPISTDTQDKSPSTDETRPEPDVYLQYQDYIEARKRLLQTVASVHNPLLSKHKSNREVPARHTSKSGVPTMAMPVTPLVREKVFNASGAQISIASQRKFLTSTINGEHAKIRELLSKLRDESHLLSAYPMLVRRNRFKNISGKVQSSEADGHVMEDEVGSLIQSWEFASEAARIARNEHVQTHLSLGKVSLGDAAECLDDLRAQVGQNSRTWNATTTAAEDIWTTGIDRDVKQSGGNSQGAWSGLNGRLGLS